MGFSKLQWIEMLITLTIITVFYIWLTGNGPFARREARKRKEEHPEWYK